MTRVRPCHPFQRLWILLFLAAMGWTAGPAAAQDFEDGRELLGTEAPAWQLDAWLHSEPLTLRALRGRVVLLRFWTDRCPSCAANVPHLSQWHEQYASRGLVVIGIYHPKPPGELDRSSVERAADALGMRFPIAMDPDWETLGRYWLSDPQPLRTSASFLIDQAGRIRHVHAGGAYSAEDAEALEAVIEQLLGG